MLTSVGWRPRGAAKRMHYMRRNGGAGGQKSGAASCRKSEFSRASLPRRGRLAGGDLCPRHFSFRTDFPMPLQLRHLRCRCGAGAYANLWCSVGAWRRIGNQNARSFLRDSSSRSCLTSLSVANSCRRCQSISALSQLLHCHRGHLPVAMHISLRYRR
jgi:hypothetical protein